jgi:hypothetical protein
VAACIFATNTGSGYAVEGTSNSTYGVVGVTTFDSSKSTTGSKAGVAGYDRSTNGFNSGVYGTSVSGFGVSGTSQSSHGVNGASSKSFGVVGWTTVKAADPILARAGVYGEDLSTDDGIYNSGVSGISKFGIGSLGETYTGVAVEGLAVQNGGFLSKPKYLSIGVYGDADLGPGVFGFAHGTTSTSYGVGAFVDAAERPALYAEADGSAGTGLFANVLHPNGYILEGTTGLGSAAVPVVSIDGRGNEILSGTLTENGTPLVRTRVSTGGDVATFGVRSSSPTLEDVGEATLVRGAAHVAIDRAFAATMDPHAKYFVFLTPEGDSRGLFVSALSNRGFDVCENGGGRSTLAFQFRIVAKPYDTGAARLPALGAPASALERPPTKPVAVGPNK